MTGGIGALPDPIRATPQEHARPATPADLFQADLVQADRVRAEQALARPSPAAAAAALPPEGWQAAPADLAADAPTPAPLPPLLTDALQALLARPAALGALARADAAGVVAATPPTGRPDSVADGGLAQRSAGSVAATATAAATPLPTTATTAADGLSERVTAMLTAAGYHTAAVPAPAVTATAVPPQQAAPHARAAAGGTDAAAAASAVAASLPGSPAPSHGNPVHGPRQRDARADDAASGRLATYHERRQIPLDVAPVILAQPLWRLDDTHTQVMVDGAGPAAAARRAAELYRALVDQVAGLAALRPGEGFITWDGSPLWLSLAGIGKPARLGVLLAEAQPARVEVMRLPEGDWFIAHAGGGWPAPRRRRHDRHADDGEDLLRDLLYGVDGDAAAASVGFTTAVAQCHAAGRLSDPVQSWRAQEAWAALARHWGRCVALGRPAGALATALTLGGEAGPAGGIATGALLAPLGRGELPAVTAEQGVALAAGLGRLPRQPIPLRQLAG